LSGAPQTITRRGRSAVVVVSAEEWERREARRGNLAEFLATAPRVELKIERDKRGMRKIEL
jgi:PHD/YefM family antitoxin component YafN of YafNO toxin-antitoxin module